jgi:hypothetical protein
LEPLAEDEDEDLYLDRAIEILKEELNANSQAKNR